MAPLRVANKNVDLMVFPVGVDSRNEELAPLLNTVPVGPDGGPPPGGIVTTNGGVPPVGAPVPV